MLFLRECINRVCEAAGLKTADKKRKAEKRVQRAIAEHPIMEHAGANVNLTISSCGLVLTALESGRIIARHDMPRISFASGGDTVSAGTWTLSACFIIFLKKQFMQFHLRRSSP
jgi:SHC-transforming protein 1